MGSVPQLQFDVPEDPFGRRIDEGFGHSPQSVVEDRTEVLHGGPDPGFAVGLGGGGERNGVHVRPRRGETSRRKIAPVIVLLFSTYFYQSHPRDNLAERSVPAPAKPYTNRDIEP